MAMEEYDSPEFAPKRSKRQRPSPSPTSPPMEDHGKLWRATNVQIGWDDNKHMQSMAERGRCSLCMAVAPQQQAA